MLFIQMKMRKQIFLHQSFCDINLYETLAEYGTLAKKEELRETTKTEGYDISLIVPSNASYVSKEYVEITK